MTFLRVQDRLHGLVASVAVVALVALAASPARAAVPPGERAALVAIYNATGGPHWTDHAHWLGPVGTECTWTGVQCSAAKDHVTGFVSSNNHLVGTLPAAISGLTELQGLNLQEPGLTGPFPLALASLPRLTLLSLANTGLGGAIPPELGAAPALAQLYLQGNHFTGPLPPELGNLASLRTLSLYNETGLGGTFPGFVSELTGLTNVSAVNCGFTGPFPDLSALTALTFLSLSDHYTPGPVPDWIIADTRLSVIALAGTNRTGPFPDLSSHALSVLVLDANAFDPGPIPSWVDRPELSVLSLNATRRTGPLPDFGGNDSLSELHLGHNAFTPGPIPDWIAASNIGVLDLTATNRTGTIPAAFGSASGLYELYLGQNQLGGAIPLGLAATLSFLDLSSNKLTGAIPADLGPSAKYLYFVDLRWNGLSSNNAAQVAYLNARAYSFRSPGTGGAFDFRATQTIPPSAGLSASPNGPQSLKLKWAPPTYTADAGFYSVFEATRAAGPYSLVNQVSPKKASTFTVSGLKPSTTYYFKLRMTTQKHANNTNVVQSLDGPVFQGRTSS